MSTLLAATVALTTYLHGLGVGPSFTHVVGGPPAPPAIPPQEVFHTDKLTFILLGYDSVDRFAHRSDTLMIGAVDFVAKSVRILSIPRDTLVRIPRHGFDKINAAYSLGQEQLVLDTLQQFTGVKFDYIISVNYEGFVEVVDAFGGVDLKVERAMHYDDRRGNVHIHFEPGEYHMNGQQALEYARFRHDAMGDIGRIQRQQQLIMALFEQAIRPQNWRGFPAAAQAFLDNITVTVNPENPRNVPQIGFLEITSALGFLSSLDSSQIRFYQLPCVDVRWRGLACLRPIYSRSRDVLAEVFQDYAPVGWERLESSEPTPSTENSGESEPHETTHQNQSSEDR